MTVDKQPIKIHIKRVGVGARRLILGSGKVLVEEDQYNWAVLGENDEVLDFGCDVIELIEEYGVPIVAPQSPQKGV